MLSQAPFAGAHVDALRRATVAIDVSDVVRVVDTVGTGPPPEDDGGATANAPENSLDAFWAALGYVVGELAGYRVPVVLGLEDATPVDADDLKAFSAAFGTTGAAPLFHVAGQTPCEGLQSDVDDLEVVVANLADFQRTWRDLSQSGDDLVDLVALGSPHFSTAELERLDDLVAAAQPHAVPPVVRKRACLQDQAPEAIANRVSLPFL